MCFFIALIENKMPMTLNTHVHVVTKDGFKEVTTVRGLLSVGKGTSFEAFKMLDEYEMLCSDYQAELEAAAAAELEAAAAAEAAAAELDDRHDHLPFGAHLLPQNYQDFLYNWNKKIATVYGDWVGPARDAYKRDFPILFKEYMRQNKRFKDLYPEQVEQVKAYQAEHKDDSVEETLELPAVQEVQAQPQAQVEAQPQPQVEPEAQAQPKVKPLVSYNDSRWPSPIPKVFVQRIRGDNAWNYRYPGKTAWTSDFKNEWQLAGNTEFKLTHENCVRYLAYRMGGRTIEQFLEMTREQVRSKLIFGRLPNSLYK